MFIRFFDSKLKKKSVHCRAVLLDIATDERDTHEGVLNFELRFVLISPLTYETKEIRYSFVGVNGDIRADYFFGFLKKKGIRYEEYYELVGLVADVEICKSWEQQEFFVFKKLLAKPPKLQG